MASGAYDAKKEVAGLSNMQSLSNMKEEVQARATVLSRDPRPTSDTTFFSCLYQSPISSPLPSSSSSFSLHQKVSLSSHVHRLDLLQRERCHHLSVKRKEDWYSWIGSWLLVGSLYWGDERLVSKDGRHAILDVRGLVKLMKEEYMLQLVVVICQKYAQ